MSAPKRLETEYTSIAEIALMKVTGDDFELRLQILEASAALISGLDPAAYYDAFGIKNKKPVNELIELSAPIVDVIKNIPIHPSLVLSVLAREDLREQDRKSTGAYHTDFRLAGRLAQLASNQLTYKSIVIDPACGAGILLSALTLEVCGEDCEQISYWFRYGVCAADLSEKSLRATLLSLASFSNDLEALVCMRSRWFCGDSLLLSKNSWIKMSPHGFDAVIGNPPWEKVKISRHEFLKSSGTKRSYGTKISGLDEEMFAAKKDEVSNYSQKLLSRFPNLGCGEPDLYIAFTELFFELCKPGGLVAALIPGGFIRSLGTKVVREKIFSGSRYISISIIDNKARFFEIDTRFKFLAVAFVKAEINTTETNSHVIDLKHERGTSASLEVVGSTKIRMSDLEKVRSDLSIPEVRNLQEWELFVKICKKGISWEKVGSGWKPKFCREVDMSKERSKFLHSPITGSLPLIEGRMVQAHRLGVKKYVSGSGRSSLWEVLPPGESFIAPQFSILLSDIPLGSVGRTKKLRVGFCDIAGQTNERSLMAALIPPEVVCGNKVPTITFPEDTTEDRMLVWLSIANSFIFDWMLRRILTTTVNYFLLQSIPLPKIEKDSVLWKKLAQHSRDLNRLDEEGNTQETYDQIIQHRSKIDAAIAIAYGLDLHDLEVIFNDFPLLDRKQPILPGEKKSSITRDLVLATMAKKLHKKNVFWQDRVNQASALGARPYMPSEFAQIIRNK